MINTMKYNIHRVSGRPKHFQFNIDMDKAATFFFQIITLYRSLLLHIALKIFLLQQIFLFDIVAANSKASSGKEDSNFSTSINFK